MLPQQALLDRIVRHAEASPEVVGLLAFGSFATGTADALSDLDLGLYVEEDAFESFDLRRWLEPVAPVAAIFVTEYCSTVLFRDLVRAEIHLGPPAAADVWPPLAGTIAFPSLERMVLLDRTGTFADRVRPLIGRLPPRTRDDGDHEFLGLANWLIAADGCWRRGELARALTFLSTAQLHLLRLARLDAGTIDEWVTPARRLERDLPAATVARYATTTAPLDGVAIGAAIEASWRWGRELARRAAGRPLDEATLADLDRRLSADTAGGYDGETRWSTRPSHAVG